MQWVGGLSVVGVGEDEVSKGGGKGEDEDVEDLREGFGAPCFEADWVEQEIRIWEEDVGDLRRTIVCYCCGESGYGPGFALLWRCRSWVMTTIEIGLTKIDFSRDLPLAEKMTHW